MTTWWSAQSLSLALCVAAGLRAAQHKALSLASPSTVRRARTQVVRLITVVAGH